MLSLSKFHYTFLSLRSSNRCLRLLPRLPFYLSFINVFWKEDPTQDVTNPVRLSFIGWCFLRWLYVILALFTRLSRLIFLTFSSITFQIFQRMFYLFSEVPKFHHHTKPCSKYSTLLFSSFKFKANLLMKRVFLLLNAAFAVTIMDLISYVHHVSGPRVA